MPIMPIMIMAIEENMPTRLVNNSGSKVMILPL
jgi:hypothetical protein